MEDLRFDANNGLFSLIQFDGKRVDCDFKPGQLNLLGLQVTTEKRQFILTSPSAFANQGFCYLNLAGITKFKYEGKIKRILVVVVK